MAVFLLVLYAWLGFLALLVAVIVLVANHHQTWHHVDDEALERYVREHRGVS